MRKNFITKEYTLEQRPGTLSMLEQRNFYGSKILEIPDVLTVDDTNVIWTESSDSTQKINIDDQTKILDVNVLKKNNHSIIRTLKQSDKDIKEYTNYTFTIDVEKIIFNWIFSQLKKNQTFGGIKNSETKTNNINDSVNEYIEKNVLKRIKFSTINLYARYFQIGTFDENSNVSLQYDIRYSNNIIIPKTVSGESTESFLKRSDEFKKSLKVVNFDLSIDAFGKTVTLNYKQTNSSQNYKYNYYFDVVYIKA